MYMLSPDLPQFNTILHYIILYSFPKSQGARAQQKKKKVKGPGPRALGPKKVLGTMGPGRVPRTFFGPRARGPGPLTSLNIISLDLEEIWVEHIHIAPQRGYAVRVNKY